MIQTIFAIIHDMAPKLSPSQLNELQNCLVKNLIEEPVDNTPLPNQEYIDRFVAAKRIEGRADRTLTYYTRTLRFYLDLIDRPSIVAITTEDIRAAMDKRLEGGLAKSALDSERLALSSFFGWMVEEEYILYSPMARIHKIKAPQKVKTVFTGDELEYMRDLCRDRPRDLAIIDLLYSSGIRVGELHEMNIEDVNFETNEIIVHKGKGSKERIAYLDSKAKLHLRRYLEKREDDDPALVVSSRGRMTTSAIERMIRKLGEEADIPICHPHKFRRSLATHAIDKGMPIEQVQKMLGHTKIDTTLEYAQVDQENVKQSHKKILG